MTGRVEKNGEGEILGEKKGQGSKVQHFLNWCRMGCDGITGRQKERDRLRSTMTLICRQRLLKERRRKKKKKCFGFFYSLLTIKGPDCVASGFKIQDPIKPSLIVTQHLVAEGGASCTGGIGGLL